MAYPLRNATTVSVIRCLTNYFLHLGIPQAIIADNGPCFSSKKLTNYLTSHGVKLYHSTPYHPQSNPVERIHREVNRLWRLMCQGLHHRWSYYLHDIVFLLNYTISDSLGMAPAQAHLNVKDVIPILRRLDLLETNADSINEWDDRLMWISERKKKRTAKRDKKDKEGKHVMVGDLIFLRNHMVSDADSLKIKKMFDVYCGPYVCFGKPSSKVVDVIDPLDSRIVGRRSEEQCRIWNPTDDIYEHWIQKINDEVIIKIFDNITDSNSVNPKFRNFIKSHTGAKSD